MKRSLLGLCSFAVVISLSSQAHAFTSKGKSTLSIGASGVTESTTFTTAVVTQGTADPGTAATLTFGPGGNTFRDSGEAIRVDVNTNTAGNKVIIYTDNLAGTAVPQAQINTGTGIDGGGLVGVTDKTQTVPLLWVVKDTNTPDFVFTTATIGDDETFIVDRAHVRTFVQVVPGQVKNGTLDNMLLKTCDPLATPPIPVTNIANDGLYTQYFGAVGQNLDVCSNEVAAVVINGVTINPGAPVPFAQELVKNISVVAFGFLGTSGTVTIPGATPPNNTATVTSPIFLPIGGDFRTAPAQDYATSTLTVELITQ